MAIHIPANLREEDRNIPTAVAIDRDKNSQFAVKWAVENLKLKDNQIILVHINTTQHNTNNQDVPIEGVATSQSEMQRLFLPYRGFCARKGVRATEVILHDLDIASALSEYINSNSFTAVVFGAPNRGVIGRAFRNTDVPSSVGKSTPDSCSVYVVSKGKALKIKSGSEPATPSSAIKPTSRGAFSQDSLRHSKLERRESRRGSAPDLLAIDGENQQRGLLHTSKHTSPPISIQNGKVPRERHFGCIPSPPNPVIIHEFMRLLPFEKRHHDSKSPTPLVSANNSFESNESGSSYNSTENTGPGDNEFAHLALQDCKISALPQPENNLSFWFRTKEGSPCSASGSSNYSGSSIPSDVSFEHLDQPRISDSSRCSTSSQTAEIEDELKRMKLELKQITEKYNFACQEAMTARCKVRDIIQWRSEEGSKLGEAIHGQAAALAIVERERLKCKAAAEVARKAHRIADLESEKRKNAEMKFKQESKEKQKAIDALAHTVVRYRKYTISEIEVATDYFSDSDKIGEGGYGPVYKATLDHTSVAIKVLRPDISQGQIQFQREVEVLSRMRHPHMVILLGACPEYGCLVYEYMENGTLEDRLYRRNGTPPLPWSSRFRIAAEIATALNFLHQTRPEPLVHRDLKPANILLDKNYVSKISDVGLSRLVPAPLADDITQYRMTAAAGTFCYIDPEYQQTGMLRTKSDIYSLGVVLLQIITARPPMGLTHHVESALEMGHFAEVLDPTVKDWPIDEALSLAKLALKCCELRRKDRPDLDSVIVPQLERLRDLGSQPKPEARFYYMYSQESYEESSPSSQVGQNKFDYMNLQGQSSQESSQSSQESTTSNSEMHMEINEDMHQDVAAAQQQH